MVLPQELRPELNRKEAGKDIRSVRQKGVENMTFRKSNILYLCCLVDLALLLVCVL